MYQKRSLKLFPLFFKGLFLFLAPLFFRLEAQETLFSQKEGPFLEFTLRYHFPQALTAPPLSQQNWQNIQKDATTLVSAFLHGFDFFYQRPQKQTKRSEIISIKPRAQFSEPLQNLHIVKVEEGYQEALWRIHVSYQTNSAQVLMMKKQDESHLSLLPLTVGREPRLENEEVFKETTSSLYDSFRRALKNWFKQERIQQAEGIFWLNHIEEIRAYQDQNLVWSRIRLLIKSSQ